MLNLDLRPEANRYSSLLTRHILNVRGPDFIPFDGKMTLPRQVEIQLSNDTGVACNLSCRDCQGQMLTPEMASMNGMLYSLIKNLQGRVPLFVISGINSEPTLNPGLIDLIELIKSTGSSYGLHTNGVLLSPLEIKNNFVTRLMRVSDANDYVSVSLDAGSPESYAWYKRVPEEYYLLAMKGVNMLSYFRLEFEKDGPRLRLTYLLNKFNCSQEEIESVVRTATILDYDSLRFSVPYPFFGLSMDKWLEHRDNFEVPLFAKAIQRFLPFLSRDPADRPFVFVLSPETQDLSKFSFAHCFYGYQMITLGSDAYFYRCSAGAHSFFRHLRLGMLTDNIEEFYRMILMNQDKTFDPQVSCFPFGARCNRGAIEINSEFEDRYSLLFRWGG